MRKKCSGYEIIVPQKRGLLLVQLHISSSDFQLLCPQDDVDPEQFWEIIGELGDGAFGKVSCLYQENFSFPMIT